MRHRLGGLQNVFMGLGADNIPFELDNSWGDNVNLNEVVTKMFDDALKRLFKPNDIYGFDYKVTGDISLFKIMFGHEPAYKHDPYLMFCISSNRLDSYMKKGVARGYYGRDVEITYMKTAAEEDCDKEFLDFLDKWYPQFMETIVKVL